MRFLALTLTLMLLISISAALVVASNGSSSSRRWTFAVYMVADNNLDTAALEDIHEMQSVGSTDQVGVVVLVDRFYVNGSQILYISKGYNQSVWGEWSSEYELNMGDPATLTWFLEYVASNYPAEHYALVLWDHGDGWNGFGWDDTNSDHLTVEEIKNALINFKDVTGVKIDLLGFDACLMASVEVAYTLSLTDEVSVLVASEDYVPWSGWPYDTILSKLVENPELSPVELASLIVDEYVESYEHGTQGFAPYVTLSAIDLSQVRNIVGNLGYLANELMTNLKKHKDTLRYAVESSERFWFGAWHQGPYIDLRDFLEKLATRESLKSYVDPVLNDWQKVVIASRSSVGPHKTNCWGLTIYYPRNKNQFYMPEPYYVSVPEFTQVTGWYDLLVAYFS